MRPSLVTFQGKSLSELRIEANSLETKLPLLRGGAAVYSWSYFEKLVMLHNGEPDQSEETASMPPGPPSDIKVESLLDTLLWAVAKFGSLSATMQKLAELADKIRESNAALGPKVDNQNLAIAKISDAVIGLAAHIKVGSEAVSPILQQIKSLSKASHD